MKYAINAFVLMGLALLVLIQKDVDGNLLINGWHGLGLADIALVFAALLNLHWGFSEHAHDRAVRAGRWALKNMNVATGHDDNWNLSQSSELARLNLVTHSSPLKRSGSFASLLDPES